MTNKTELKKKFAKYPSCFGEYDLKGLCDIARKNGMKIIVAYKPDMHVSCEIGLYGTQIQMTKTEKQWDKAGNTLMKFKRGLQFGLDLATPESEWADNSCKIL